MTMRTQSSELQLPAFGLGPDNIYAELVDENRFIYYVYRSGSGNGLFGIVADGAEGDAVENFARPFRQDRIRYDFQSMDEALRKPSKKLPTPWVSASFSLPYAIKEACYRSSRWGWTGYSITIVNARHPGLLGPGRAMLAWPEALEGLGEDGTMTTADGTALRSYANAFQTVLIARNIPKEAIITTMRWRTAGSFMRPYLSDELWATARSAGEFRYWCADVRDEWRTMSQEEAVETAMGWLGPYALQTRASCEKRARRAQLKQLVIDFAASIFQWPHRRWSDGIPAVELPTINEIPDIVAHHAYIQN